MGHIFSNLLISKVSLLCTIHKHSPPLMHRYISGLPLHYVMSVLLRLKPKGRTWILWDYCCLTHFKWGTSYPHAKCTSGHVCWMFHSGCDTGSSLPLLKLSKAQPIHCSCSACIILYLVINFALLYHATGQVYLNIYLVWVGLQDPCGTLPTQDSLWFYLQTCRDSKVSTDKQQPLEMWHRCTKGDHIWQHFPKIPVGEKAFPMQTHVS